MWREREGLTLERKIPLPQSIDNVESIGNVHCDAAEFALRATYGGLAAGCLALDAFCVWYNSGK